jgi:hypothetical protein
VRKSSAVVEHSVDPVRGRPQKAMACPTQATVSRHPRSSPELRRAVVRKFLGEHPYSFPILLDPGGETGRAYLVQGIPNSFVYDRGGKIVAMGADQRTERQFLEMLGKAGLR